MKTQITKGPTIYDHIFRERIEEMPAAVQDLKQHNSQDALIYLRNSIHNMERFDMTRETATHHVERLINSCDYPTR